MVEIREEMIVDRRSPQGQYCITKGKRTEPHERGYVSDPLALTMACSCSSEDPASIASRSTGTFNAAPDKVSSSGTAGVESSTGSIVKDTANCLILLGRGERVKQPVPPPVEPASAGSNGGEWYRCKTCNRFFPSFQALGGHSASHKKPRPMVNVDVENTSRVGTISFTELSLQIRLTGQGRVHQCSICGAEFMSGQALGGHMRRHRAIATQETAVISATSSGSLCGRDSGKVSRNLNLHLDLNLPAP
ncbi:hypothetical protein SAY86_015327 [Trapa natans]|uniref:C2H2-type domain-containing protein n=1 Tax=Trapa natans TaxID=22666 RepID=A0AAN7KJQ2_TRANT|nr:hypothetical protein SAY86_015327 [Trapa natans]